MLTIITDATNDLDSKYYEENNVHLIPMNLNLDGETIIDDKTLDLHEFYEKIKTGKLPTTSMISPIIYEEIFEEYLKKGDDVLYIGFSSGLSGSFNASLMAKRSLQERYPNAKIECIDSQSASMGMGILVKKATSLRASGKSIEEIKNYLEELKNRIFIFLGVDNLFHLQRGGRISKASAIVGTALQLKPIIKVDENGKLSSFKKVMGRKKLIQTLTDYFEKYRDNNEGDNVYILHGDCELDAQDLKNKLDKAYNINSQIYGIGTIVGSHTGVGALAIIFVSTENKTQIK